MKLTDRLVGDHRTFRKLLQEIDGIADSPVAQRDTARLVRLVELFKDHLTVHAWAEDVFYYPAVREALPKAPPPLTLSYMDHLDQEHQTVDGYLSTLEPQVKAHPPVVSWPQTYALFSKGLLAHMKKEEEELFPISEKVLGVDQLEKLSTDLEARRTEAPRFRLHTKNPA